MTPTKISTRSTGPTTRSQTSPAQSPTTHPTAVFGNGSPTTATNSRPLTRSQTAGAAHHRISISSSIASPTTPDTTPSPTTARTRAQTAAAAGSTHLATTTPSALPPPHIKPTIYNLVATVDLGCRLSLPTIAQHARNAEYNPRRFAACVVRLRAPRTTALIFASGKMVVTGAKNIPDSRLACRKFARMLTKLGFAARFEGYKVQNVVGSVSCGFVIRLEGLCFGSHMQFVTYAPELFPGLVYRMLQPKVVLLVFARGKMVLTGAKSREEIDEAFVQIWPVLLEYRR